MNRITHLVAIALLGGLAQADTITFSSQGTALDPNEYNALGATVVTTPHPGWVAALSGSSWVSYGSTGIPYTPGFSYTANGAVISFFELLTLPEAPLVASLTYRADDSAGLYINNTLVRAEAPQQGNTYFTCSDFAVGCKEQTQLTLDISSYLVQGVNTLRFDVAQRAGHAFGLNYAGSVEYVVRDDVDTPEPATFGLIGATLIAAGLFRRKQ